MDNYESKYKGSDQSNYPPSSQENFHQNFVIEPLNYPNFENKTSHHQEDNQYYQQIGSNQIRQEIQQPLVVPQLPIIQGDIDLNFQKRILLQKLNKLLIYQQLFQVCLPLICYLFGTFDQLFGRFYLSELKINVYAWIIIIHTLMYLLLVRFNTSIRTVIKSISLRTKIDVFIQFILFYIQYVSTAYGLILILFNISVANYNLRKRIWRFPCSDFSCKSHYANLILSLIRKVKVIKFEFDNNNQNDLAFLINTCYSVFFLLTIWLSLYANYIDEDFVFFVLFLVFWPFVFTLFYVQQSIFIIFISSLLQVYKGKFQLGPQQEHIGSVLVITNMFLLCVPDL